MSRPIVPPAAPFRGTDGTKKPSQTSIKSKTMAGRPTNIGGGNHHRRHRFEIVSAQTKLIFRMVALALVTGHFLAQTFVNQLLPHGPPVRLTERPTPLTIDRDSTLLQLQHGRTQRIYERLEPGEKSQLVGPETVVVHPKTGALFVMTATARLLLLSDLQTDPADASHVTAKTTYLHSLGSGRPLGGAFTPDGKTLYIADAVIGLVRLHNPTDPRSKVELVVNEIDNSRLLYADDVAIGPKTGLVYFTDASDVAADRVGYKQKAHWDTLFASKVDLVRGKAAGRVLEYNPATDTTRVLVEGLKFANGIAVDKDETYLIVSQTFGPRISKYYLKGDQAGTLESVLEPEQLTGYPDGADCAWDEGNNYCYAAIPSAYSPVHALYNKLPDPLDRVVRTVLLLLPRWLAPPVQKYGGIIEMNVDSKEHRYIKDPSGRDVSMITGVTYYNNKLYLGSLENTYVGVYNLQGVNA